MLLFVAGVAVTLLYAVRNATGTDGALAERKSKLTGIASRAI